MKLFGTISELVAAVFRKDSQAITVRPNQSISYTAARDIQLPPGDFDQVLSSANSTQALINKTIDGDDNTVQDLPITALKDVLGDANKVLRRDVNGVATSGNALPNSSDIVTTDATQSLTNKNLLDTTTAIADATDQTIQIRFNAAGTTSTSTTLRSNQSTSAVLDLPGETDWLVSRISNDSASGRLKNKDLEDATTDFVDSADTTKKVKIDAAGTTGTRTTILSSQTVDRTLTLPDITDTLVTRTNTETLTNKTISGSGNTITNVPLATGVTGTLPIANGGTGQTTASAAFGAVSPLTTKGDLLGFSTSNIRLPVGADGQVLAADSTAAAGVAWSDGGAGGAGELNAVENPSAASGVTGYTDGTSHTISRITSGSPLDPIVSTAFNISATANATESSTGGSYYSIGTLASSLLNKKLKVEMYVVIPSTETWKLSIYAGATRLSLSTDSSGSTSIPAGFTGKFTTYFDTTSATAYSVNITRTAGTGTTSMQFTNLIVGPGIQPQGAVVGPWLSFTPTGTWVANSTYTGVYRRVGSDMELEVKIALTGAPTASALVVNLPTGFTIDTASLVNTTAGKGIYGAGTAFDTSASDTFSLDIAYNNTSSVAVRYKDATTFVRSANITASSPFVVASGDSVVLRFTAPIAQWSGSGTVNLAQNDVEYASSSTGTWDAAAAAANTVYGPSGSAITGALTASRSKVVRFTTPVSATDKLFLEFQLADGSWVDHVSYAPYIGTGNQSFGARFIGIANNTDVSVQFNRYRLQGTTFDSLTGAVDWTAGVNWRLRKAAAGSAVGFGLASLTTSGLIAPGQFPGTSTNDTAPTGYVGEVIAASKIISASTALTAGVSKGILLVNLTPGEWEIRAFAGFSCTAAITRLVYGIANRSVTAGDTLPANSTIAVPSANGELMMRINFASFNPNDEMDFSSAPYRVSLSTTTQFDLVMRQEGSAGTSAYGYLMARRVR